ncbi:MAG: hypothetical protein F4Z54_07650 [Acidimicrobiaceae bacterium]|nr:hypothetical protein [Acidimicrobiaceae bacterium]
MPSARSSSAISFSMCSRDRSSINCEVVIFLIWWVALRPSKPCPRVHPLIVLARMTVGWSLTSTAALNAAYTFW